MQHAHDATRDSQLGEYRTSRRRLLTAPFLLLAMIAALSAACFAKSKPVTWKAITDALLRVNDSPVKDWGVYQAGKKADPLLLQMGNRFLLIEIHDRQLFEIDPSEVESKSDDLLWDPADRPANPIATSGWEENDIGGAFRIDAKIDAEGRVLSLQLQHPPDLGELPARTAPPRRMR